MPRPSGLRIDNDVFGEVLFEDLSSGTVLYLKPLVNIYVNQSFEKSRTVEGDPVNCKYPFPYPFISNSMIREALVSQLFS